MLLMYQQQIDGSHGGRVMKIDDAKRKLDDAADAFFVHKNTYDCDVDLSITECISVLTNR